ncbi:MAG: STAS domain-containing protein [Leptospiraceae bacterium]|nr:STAS domain-containing protein [Leptospiraceae bacterium]MCB1316173.1 STAS domain-containing protein [Leptospiraceae bacterium]MCB1318845.1 STAS domain-containing protein [Leptospiraceae bacterium]
MNLQYSERRVNGALILDIDGKLDVSSGNDLEKVIEQLAGKGEQKIVLNMQAVSYVDSAGIGSIIKSSQMLIGKGAELRMAALQGRVLEIFQSNNLHRHVGIYPSEEEAVQ